MNFDTTVEVLWCNANAFCRFEFQNLIITADATATQFAAVLLILTSLC